MSELLCQSASILCPHGGLASATPVNQMVKTTGSPVLLDSDVFTVAGCPLNISGKPSPCVRIQWQVPAAAAKLIQGKPLTSSSLGLCYNPEGAPQGSAIIASTQIFASAR